MARRALQVIRYRPVEFVSERRAYFAGDCRANATELRVAEGVLGANVGQEATLGVTHALGDDDRTVAMILDGKLHCSQEARLVKGHFWEQNQVRRLAVLGAGEAGGP